MAEKIKFHRKKVHNSGTGIDTAACDCRRPVTSNSLDNKDSVDRPPLALNISEI